MPFLAKEIFYFLIDLFPVTLKNTHHCWSSEFALQESVYLAYNLGLLKKIEMSCFVASTLKPTSGFRVDDGEET